MVDGMNPNQMVQTMLNALRLLEAEQNGTAATPLTLPLKMEASAESSTASLRNVINEMAASEKLWLANGFTETITGTAEDTDIVPGGTYEKARWVEIYTVFSSLQAWLATPAGEGGPVPMNVIFRDYVPPVVE